MRFALRLSATLCLLVSLVVITEAKASGFYVSPRVGGAISLDESSGDFATGIGIGYRWEKLFALEADYERLFTDVETNLLLLNFTLSYIVEKVGPYFIAGVGTSISTARNTDPEVAFRIGSGVTYEIYPYVKPFIQASYLNIDGDDHFFEPYAGILFGF